MFWVLFFALLSQRCTTPYEEPPRVQIAVENDIEHNSVNTVSIAVTKGDGTPGVGSVYLTASQGVLSQGPQLDLVAGTASTTLTCTDCKNTMTFVATWLTFRAERVIEVKVGDGG